MSTSAIDQAQSRWERRLSTPITVPEAFCVVLSLVATVVLFPRAYAAAYNAVYHLEGLGWFFAFGFLGMAVPGFVIPFVLMAITPWRFKLVAGVASQFVLIYWGARLMIASAPGGFWFFAGEVGRFAFLHGGALLALLAWGAWRDRKLAGATPFPSQSPQETQEQPPRSPVVIQLLALVSIPAIYIGILAGALVTVGIGLVLLLLISQAGRVPVWLIVVAYGAPIVGLITAVYSLGRAIFPQTPTEPAVAVSPDEAPELWALVSEVCRRMNTREPDHVVLHALPAFYVMQGRLQLHDKSEIRGRILAIGLPALRELRASELKSILTHEFAHFSGGDTTYSAFGARVYGGLHAAIRAIRSGGDIGGRVGVGLSIVQIPATYYMVSYYRYMMSLDSAISRRRELRADWYAVNRYGKEAFVSGLRKVVGVSAHFPEAIKSIDLSDPLQVYTTYAKHLTDHPHAYQDLLRQATEQGETEFSSHPRLEVRFQAAAQVPIASAQEILREPSMEKVVAELANAEEILAASIGASVIRYQEQATLDDDDYEDEDERDD